MLLGARQEVVRGEVHEEAQGVAQGVVQEVLEVEGEVDSPVVAVEAEESQYSTVQE